MPRAIVVLLCALFVAAPTLARGRGGHHSTSTHSHSSRATGTKKSHSSWSDHPTRTHYRSHIKRDPAQRRSFMRSHPCPSTGRRSGACPGYVVDHIKALKRGGPDRPSNMQWQTVADAKAKDRIE